jgi:hypothetical protein
MRNQLKTKKTLSVTVRFELIVTKLEDDLSETEKLASTVAAASRTPPTVPLLRKGDTRYELRVHFDGTQQYVPSRDYNMLVRSEQPEQYHEYVVSSMMLNAAKELASQAAQIDEQPVDNPWRILEPRK